MTVESTTRKQSFAGGQSTLTFSFRALVDSPEDIKVVAVTSGTETLLTYTSEYTVAVNADGVGGVVTVSPSYSTAYTYTVYRETTNKQESDYDDYNQFPADTLEEDLDRRTLVDQEQSEDLERSVRVPVSSALSGSSLLLPTPTAGRAIKWNATADGLANSSGDIDTSVTEAANYASTASTQAGLAAASAAAASTSESNASASETSASNSATTASTQATLAGNYATTASTEAAAAVLSASTASTQATLAGNYASTASTQATTASTQAALAGNYASTASTQATTASTQAALAGNYATTASTQAALAGNYATTASTAATLAGNYATTASTAAATIPDVTGGTPGDIIQVNGTSTAYELAAPGGGTVVAPTSVALFQIPVFSSTTGTMVVEGGASLTSGTLTVTNATITSNLEASGTVTVGTLHVTGKTTGVPKIKVGAFSRLMTDGSGDQAITGVGFTPKALILGALENNTLFWSLGMLTAENGGCMYQGGTAGVLKITLGVATGAASIFIWETGANYQYAVWKSFDADGFTMTWTKAGTPSATSASTQYIAIG